ncbi:unnamed protein product [Owenia fusiformis]|uniref:Uncharacterized protein n=1 Tax=Owenia fusiformis TaxID=6347 RepID=A0A8J1UHD5_OWEFU|nr:unnamed protein product [Owenia fusiformis]
MPKNKTRLNILLLSCSALLVVMFTRQLNKDVTQISTRTRELIDSKLTTTEHLTKFNDNEEHDEDSFEVKEKMNEYTFSLSGISDTKQYHKTSFEANGKTRAYVNLNEDNDTSNIHSTEDSSEVDMGSLSNPYKGINAEDESKMRRIEQKLNDEFGFIHKANNFVRYEKENKDCDVGKVRKPPEAMIIGVQFCGTDLLRSILGAHPKIAIALGEPHFFDRNYNETLSWYLKQMPCSSPDQITIETTPSYFDLTDPARIFTFNPNMKLIVCVCDPVDRTLSDFTHEQRLGHIQKGRTFEEEVVGSDGGIKGNVAITKRSNYLYPLIRYKQYFSSNQIFFIDVALLGSQLSTAFNMLEEFLGIEKVFRKTSFWFNTKKNINCLSSEMFNITILKSLGIEEDGCMETPGVLSNPVIAEGLRDKLRKHYTVYCTGFCEMLGNHTCKAFPWSPKRMSKRSIDLVGGT